jgi:AraC family transcriptional regulator of adaptative response/methylated-DNA-[protein]-cysteine methyltransferase
MMAAPARESRRASATTERGKRSDAQRWEAVLDRDARFDGAFFYSVSSTGVYCRPSCSARRPKRENVRFHETWQAAEAAGFRPCKRCRPNGTAPGQDVAAIVAAACREIEQAETPPTFKALAAAAGLSPFHFHRVFKAATGVTPKAYARAHRRKRVRGALGQSRTVTEAIYDAGFNSNSRFYAGSAESLGMTPSAFRAGGEEAELRFAVGQCSLGAFLVAASGKGIAAILIGDDAEALVHELEDSFPRARLTPGDRGFEGTVAKVVGLVEAPETGFALPLDIRGTAFQERVWAVLRKIPPGTTVSYTDIANKLGMPKAVRAVAAACAANKIAVAIPCHRVVRSDGALSGYRWGIARKERLLAREAKAKVKA